MTTRIRYSTCSLFVQGLDMPCPLCKVMVLSGQTHECKKPDFDELATSKTVEGQGPVRRKVRRVKA